MKKVAILLLLVIAMFSCRVYVKPVPRGPKLRFVSSPELVLVPGLSAVYYAQNHPNKAFFFDGRWFIFEGGYWYASQYWKGPWAHIKKIPPGLIKAREHMRNRSRVKHKVKEKGKKKNKEKGKAKGRSDM